MKKILLIVITFSVFYLNAQIKKNIEFNSTTGFGTIIPLGNFKNETKSGFSTTFGIEVVTKKNIIAKFNLEASRLDFNSNFNDSGIEYKLNGKTDIFNLTLQMGFKQNIYKNKLFVFVMAGGGVSVLTAPQANFDFKNKTLQLEDNSGSYFIMQGTTGIEYKFSKSIILYSEITINKIPTKTFFTDNKINTLNFQIIGFKTTF